MAFLVGFFLLRRRRHKIAVRNSSLHERLLQEEKQATGAELAVRNPSLHGCAEGGGDDDLLRPFNSTVIFAPSASATGGATGGGGGGGGDGSVGIGNGSTGIGDSVALALAVGAVVTVFSAKDLSRYCAKFTNKVGEGAFGAVFVGTLPSGQRIAVKQMELAEKKKEKKKVAAGARVDPYAGEAGFRLELDVLSRYVHPQLVTLLGYCVEKQRKTTIGSIVLEFMAGGSLLKRLDPTSANPPLTAQERFDVAADVARGLHYLHAEASPPLIHQDVKSDNNLLAVVGGRLIAKVADFGTARMAPQLAMNLTHGGGKTHHSTGVIVGTKPYMPAEYLMAGHISEKTDTFAFGVVLLELLTGRPPWDEEKDSLLHMDSMELLADPPNRLAPLLDARVPAHGGGAAAAAAERVPADGGLNRAVMGSDPPRRIAPLLDARVPATEWATVSEEGVVSGRALELCLLARRCLAMLASARCTMRDAMPKAVELAGGARV